jgi:hypothetical protein
MAILPKQTSGHGSSLLQKGWLDFRNGHSVYLSFILTFMNSILIAYHFAVSQFAFLDNVFYSLGLFALFFLGIYIPTSVIIGYWHRRHQWTVENEALLQENWVWAWIARYQIRLIEGKASSEESKQVIDYLEAILQRQKNGNSLMGGKILDANGSNVVGKSSYLDEKKIYSFIKSQSKKD